MMIKFFVRLLMKFLKAALGELFVMAAVQNTEPAAVSTAGHVFGPRCWFFFYPLGRISEETTQKKRFRQSARHRLHLLVKYTVSLIAFLFALVLLFWYCVSC